MARKSNRRWSVLSVRPRIGKGIDVNSLNRSFCVRSQAHTYLHLVARRRGNLGFIAGVDDLSRPSRLHGHYSRIDFRHHGLLRPESTADSRLDHAHHGFRHIERMSEDPSHMKWNLSGGHHIQAAVCIHIGVSAKRLHHGLLVCLRMVDTINHILAPFQRALHVAVFLSAASAQITFVIRSNRTEALPVFFRMDQNLVILRLPEIEDGFQDLILHLDEAKGVIHRFLGLARHDSGCISYKPHSPVQNQPVIGAGLRIRLACHGKTLIRHILISQYTGNPVHFGGGLHIDCLNQGMSVRTAEHLYNQAVLRRQIIRIDRLSRYQRPGIHLYYRGIYRMHFHFHLASPPLARYFLMALIWPI